MTRESLTRYAWLSILAAILTIGLKAGAYLLTGSIGLLSDALESGVNLIAAIAALIALTIAARPADDEHQFGHTKAEYFSSGFEGALILVAAISIIATSINRLMNLKDIEQAGIGVLISVGASLINLAVARVLLRAAKQHDSITLEADSHHLMADVWTSIGVVAAVGAVALTGWSWLDPVIGLAVAVNIIWTGYHLMRRSLLGLLDTALPQDETQKIIAVLDQFQRQEGIRYHALRTRAAGSRRFIAVHLLVPDAWTIREGHALSERVERAIRAALPAVTMNTHIEPLDDPAALSDIALDRTD